MPDLPGRSPSPNGASRTLADLTAEQLLVAIHGALQAQDMPAVAAFLRLLAVKDPRSAQIILDSIPRPDETATSASSDSGASA